jgi:prepilin-type N-terminal cleavage/methylation domain-containing protein
MQNKKASLSVSKGFTLIEILLVIGIIAVLATVVVVALDPVTRFEDARNSRRLSDIQSILSAVQQYIVDNKGALPSGLDTNEKQLGTASSGCAITTGACEVNGDSDCLDVSGSLAPYLKTIPYDPENGSEETTHYSITVDASNIVTVTSCESTDDTIDDVSR